MNPNEYDDDAYAKASMQIHDAVGNAWEAGATVENLESEFASALENSTGLALEVTIAGGAE